MARNDAAFWAKFPAKYLGADIFKGWTGNIGSIYADSDHVIDFHDTNAAVVSLGIGRRF